MSRASRRQLSLGRLEPLAACRDVAALDRIDRLADRFGVQPAAPVRAQRVVYGHGQLAGVNLQLPLELGKLFQLARMAGRLGGPSRFLALAVGQSVGLARQPFGLAASAGRESCRAAPGFS